MAALKPQALKVGDTVAVVATSSGIATVFPDVYQAGLRNLESVLGLKVVEYPTAAMSTAELYAHPELRAKDLNDAFADRDVRAIFTTIGGEDSVRILPYLDPTIAVANPKIMMGYSDTITQLAFYHQHGLVTYNGPCVMSGFAQMNTLDSSFTEQFKLMMFGTDQHSFVPFSNWSDGYPDWFQATNAEKIADLQPADGWHWLQGSGTATGSLWGGCIDVLEFLKGTEYWPSADWHNKILFFETSEEKPSVDVVRRWLRNYGTQGVFDKVSAVLFGRARDYDTNEKIALDEAIVQVIAGEFGQTTLPIVSNMDFGHTDPQMVLPLGIEAEINSQSQTFRLLESATS